MSSGFFWHYLDDMVWCGFSKFLYSPLADFMPLPLEPFLFVLRRILTPIKLCVHQDRCAGASGYVCVQYARWLERIYSYFQHHTTYI